MRPSTKLKQQKIIKAASDLFLEQGYTQTNLDQIIERCGGSKQTIYSYFGDKRGLLTAVIGLSIEHVAAVFNFRHDDDKTLEQQLVQLGCNFLSTILQPCMVNTYRLLLTESFHDKELGEFFITQGPGRVSRYLETFLKGYMDRGELIQTDPHLACDHLINLIKCNLMQDALFGVPAPSEEEIDLHVRQAVRCFLYGYQARPVNEETG